MYIKEFNEFIRGFKEGQKSFGETIGIIINSILLSFVYLFGVGITFIFAGIFGKHFLELDINKESSSYWSELNLTKKSIKEYYRQF